MVAPSFFFNHYVSSLSSHDEDSLLSFTLPLSSTYPVFSLTSSTFSPLRYGPFQPNTSISVITIPPSHMLLHVVLQGLPHCCMISCMFTNKDEILQLLKSPSILMWEHYLTVDQARHYLAMLIFSIKCALVP